MIKLVRLCQRPDMRKKAARWFHKKWGVPEIEYLKSMEESACGSGAVPQWYLAVEDDCIAGGVGVIENDFHQRKDLRPNVCALYVEEGFRKRGLAGKLLETVCRDMEAAGLECVYLLTDHTSFYERYGWEFFCMTEDDEGEPARVYRYVLRDLRYTAETPKL